MPLAETPATKEALQARLAQWAKEAEEVDDETAAEAERAYHPDV